MSATTRLLVVANRTADSDELHTALIERRSQGPISVTLVAPACWEVGDPHGGRQSVLRRLRAATDRLGEAGIEIEGVVGNPDPFTAVSEIWDPNRFDEVIVSTLPEHLSRWLRIDLPRRVERLTGLAVRHVVARERAAPAKVAELA
jgi:hypothetical protein